MRKIKSMITAGTTLILSGTLFICTRLVCSSLEDVAAAIYGISGTYVPNERAIIPLTLGGILLVFGLALCTVALVARRRKGAEEI